MAVAMAVAVVIPLEAKTPHSAMEVPVEEAAAEAAADYLPRTRTWEAWDTTCKHREAWFMTQQTR